MNKQKVSEPPSTLHMQRVKKRVHSDRQRSTTSCAPDSPYRSNSTDSPQKVQGALPHIGGKGAMAKPSVVTSVHAGHAGKSGGSRSLSVADTHASSSPGSSSSKQFECDFQSKPKPVVCQTLGMPQNLLPAPADAIQETTRGSVHDTHLLQTDLRRGHAGRNSRDSNQEEMLLKAITEATERTRRRGQQEMQAALQRQAEQHQQEREDAIRKAIDDTLLSVQDRFHQEDEPRPATLRRGGNSKRELKAEKMRCHELQQQADRLSEEVAQLKKVAAEATEGGRAAHAKESAAREALEQLQRELRASENRVQDAQRSEEVAKAKLEVESRKNSVTSHVYLQQEETQKAEFSSSEVQKLGSVVEPESESNTGHAKQVQDKVQELEQALTNGMSALEKANKKTEELTEQLELANKEIKRKEASLTAAEAKVQSLESQLKQLDSVNWDLQRELDKITQKAKDLDGKLCVSEAERETVTLKCKESMAMLKQLQEEAQLINKDTFEILQETAAQEKERRQEVELTAKLATAQLENTINTVREDHAAAEERARQEARKSMISDFAQNSVHKQLANTKRELQETKEKLVKIQKQAKQSLEREKVNVSKLQRELASTKKMLQASQRGHKKAPSPNKHIGTNPLDAVHAARERVFGRPLAIVTKAGKADPDWEDDIWDMDSVLDMPSPSVDTWHEEVNISEVVEAELKGFSLPPIK